MKCKDGRMDFGRSAVVLPALVCVLILAGCGSAGLYTPTVAFDLPEKYNTPDGMTIDKDNNILLSMPNFNNDEYPAKIMKITPDDQLEEFYTMPKHPETGVAGPLGLDVAPDGNLYVADNQSFGTMEHKSRLIRVNVKNGKAVGHDVVVEGFIMSNAVACWGDSVYVTETALAEVGPTELHPSGIYRFKISEMQGGKPIQLEKGGKDKHLIATIYTKNEEWKVGANGLGFNKATGTLYLCNFGDAQLYKIKLDRKGEVASMDLLAEGQGMKSCDGLNVDPQTGEIYIADFLGNAIHKVHPMTGKVTTIAKNRNTDGRGGKLDKPSEVRIRGNKAYVANIDLNLDGNEYDAPHTISLIQLR